MSDKTPTQQERVNSLGAHLLRLREDLKLSLRQVEEKTQKQVSNAYLSQLENGKITQPSPHILLALATVYGESYENLMERAGYVGAQTGAGRDLKHGRAAAFSIDNLTADEEQALLSYLRFWRTEQKREKAR